MTYDKEFPVIKIHDLSREGHGIGRLEKRVVFCPNTLPGDTVKIKTMKEKGSVIYADLKEIIEPSEFRVKSPCSNTKGCKACNIIDLSYEKQLFYKKKHFIDSVNRIAGISDFQNEVPISIIPCPEKDMVRNKIELHIRPSDALQKKEIEENAQKAYDQGIEAGYFLPRTNNLIPLEKCCLLSKNMLAAVEKFKALVSTSELKGMQVIKKLIIKYSSYSNEIMLNLVLENTSIKMGNLYFKKIQSDIAGFFNDMTDSGIIQSSFITVKDNKTKKRMSKNTSGKSSLIEKIGSKKFHIEPNGFFQVNTEQANELVSAARSLFLKYFSDKNELLIDLFCGSGLFGISFSDLFENIIAIESNKASIETGIKNLKLNNIENMHLIKSKACSVKNVTNKKLSSLNLEFNPDKTTLLVDPPRKGCSKEALEAILKIAPSNIIYVSCDQPTFSRDLKKFVSKGYSPVETILIDMFPNTMHIESCTILKKL